MEFLEFSEEVKSMGFLSEVVNKIQITSNKILPGMKDIDPKGLMCAIVQAYLSFVKIPESLKPHIKYGAKIATNQELEKQLCSGPSDTDFEIQGSKYNIPQKMFEDLCSFKERSNTQNKQGPLTEEQNKKRKLKIKVKY
jgi:hypothetical protein